MFCGEISDVKFEILDIEYEISLILCKSSKY